MTKMQSISARLAKSLSSGYTMIECAALFQPKLWKQCSRLSAHLLDLQQSRLVLVPRRTHGEHEVLLLHLHSQHNLHSHRQRLLRSLLDRSYQLHRPSTKLLMASHSSKPPHTGRRLVNLQCPHHTCMGTILPSIRWLNTVLLKRHKFL
jgi:hypothetical protein